MEELELPTQSLDLNPTEHFWYDSEIQLLVRSFHPSLVPDLTNALLAEWAQISTDTLQNLAESVPRREGAVTPAKRWHISY